MHIELTILKRGVEIPLVKYTKKSITETATKKGEKSLTNVWEINCNCNPNWITTDKSAEWSILLCGKKRKNNNWQGKNSTRPIEIIWDSLIAVILLISSLQE